ncbi:hypothetical protein ERJ75_001516500 [Trypanosoma vivax]|nr:hypothetical protein ERJ75_001516500 [Trypanosoma vivax]
MDGVALLAEEMKGMREKIKAAEAQETAPTATQDLTTMLSMSDRKRGVLCKVRAHLSALKIGIGEVSHCRVTVFGVAYLRLLHVH